MCFLCIPQTIQRASRAGLPLYPPCILSANRHASRAGCHLCSICISGKHSESLARFACRVPCISFVIRSIQITVRASDSHSSSGEFSKTACFAPRIPFHIHCILPNNDFLARFLRRVRILESSAAPIPTISFFVCCHRPLVELKILINC